MPERSWVLIVDRLIDGSGADPVAAAALVVEGERITFAGPRAELRVPDDAEVLEGDDLTVLPGFIDMHVHLASMSGVDFTQLLMSRRSMLLLRAVPNCRATLRAGVTTVRDAGLSPASVRDAVTKRWFPGPRCEMAVSILGQTGGHADDRMPCGSRLPMDCGMDIPDAIVDGADTMRRRVREVLAAGADWIKLCTSGGVLSAADQPDAAQLTVEEIGVAVEEAATQNRRVMAHAISTAGIKNALRAGVVSIEHGCLLDEEALELLRARDAWLVPTLVAPRDVIAQGAQGRVPESMVEKAAALSTRHMASFRAAVEAGVNIAMGTDASVGPHGANLRELALMVEGGMSPLQAIAASTSAGARLLGRQHELGTLAPGKLADAVVVQGDPLGDISLLTRPDAIRMVVQGGTPAKDHLRRQPVGILA